MRTGQRTRAFLERPGCETLPLLIVLCVFEMDAEVVMLLTLLSKRVRELIISSAPSLFLCYLRKARRDYSRDMDDYRRSFPSLVSAAFAELSDRRVRMFRASRRLTSFLICEMFPIFQPLRSCQEGLVVVDGRAGRIWSSPLVRHLLVHERSGSNNPFFTMSHSLRRHSARWGGASPRVTVPFSLQRFVQQHRQNGSKTRVHVQ